MRNPIYRWPLFKIINVLNLFTFRIFHLSSLNFLTINYASRISNPKSPSQRDIYIYHYLYCDEFSNRSDLNSEICIKDSKPFGDGQFLQCLVCKLWSHFKCMPMNVSRAVIQFYSFDLFCSKNCSNIYLVQIQKEFTNRFYSKLSNLAERVKNWTSMFNN